MKKTRRLKTRILHLSLTINLVTVGLFVGGTLMHLRYGFKRTLDTQIEILGPNILRQLSRQGATLNSDNLPVLLTLFDDQSPVRILRLEGVSGLTFFDNPAYTKLIADYIEEQDEEKTKGREFDRFQTLWSEGRTLRVARYENDTHRIYMAADLAQVDSSLYQILAAYFIMFPISVAVSVFTSSFLARRVTDPLDKLVRQAKDTGASKLNQHISIKGATSEIDTLVTVLNEMMDRLDRSFQQAQRFSADASHELKTPLTIMQGILSQRLNHPESHELQHEDVMELMNQTNRMRMIVEALLVLAKADENSLLQVSSAMSIVSILEDLAEDAAVVGEVQNVNVTLDLRENATVMGDERLVRLAIYNLIKNGLEHARPQTQLKISTSRENHTISIRIINMGDTIPENEFERIFDRFYQIDHAREASPGKRRRGLGLGLNIASEIAKAHGGNVLLRFSEPTGTCFEITLPCT